MPAWLAHPEHSRRLNMDLLTFRWWIEEGGGSREYARFREAWAIAAEVQAAPAPAARSGLGATGRRSLYHPAEAA